MTLRPAAFVREKGIYLCLDSVCEQHGVVSERAWIALTATRDRQLQVKATGCVYLSSDESQRRPGLRRVRTAAIWFLVSVVWLFGWGGLLHVALALITVFMTIETLIQGVERAVRVRRGGAVLRP